MKTKRRFTDEFKRQAVEMVANGRSVPEVGEDLEIRTDLLYRWRRERLRAENRLLRFENIILKKAAVILETEPQPRITK